MSRELFICIGIIIGLAVGLGIGFSVFGSLGSDSQESDMQFFQEMMLDDSNTMQEMIMSTMQDSDQMQMMEDMMKDMMNRMQDDPELKQAMMEHMDRMKASKESMMGVDNTMMNEMMNSNMEKITSDLYNKDLNPRQMEYPNHLGFNDLHIEAINHVIPSNDDSVLDMTVHHQCKVYDDMTVSCLLFPTGMGDQDKPFGMEYVIGADAYAELSEEEKIYWHYHKTELPKVDATLPDLTVEEAESLMPVLNETYGKVIYFWQVGDEYPIGEPFIVKIKELYERNSP